MFKAVSPRIDIQKVEHEVLDFWRSNRIFERTMREREGGPRYVFYEGPPTANGKPGSHHVLARAYKDMFPRYKTMRGYYCLRRGGWDTHGLPVEIAVEKELGLQHKREIEEYGIARFNEKCKASVFRYITEWEKLTERIAFWVDLDTAYVTFTRDYIESVWWILKQLWDKDLIYRGYKVVPYCTRCGTPLSSHEVSQGYTTLKDPSVFVRFPLRDKPGVYFLVWTTTPWTLPGNVALAVGANVDYVQVEGPSPEGEGTEQLILAEVLVDTVLTNAANYKVVKRYKGKDLVGIHYNPLYTFLPVEQDYAYVVTGNFVSIADGTGIVHIAPAFGQEDLEVGNEYKLPVLLTIGPSGNFIDAVTKFRGMWFKKADPEITHDLRDRGLLYKAGEYEHEYPLCWRDDSPLMYVARDTWYIATTKLKDQMIANNQKINWIPEHIRDGRFGNWLDTLKDWALGRERYWGTPLPIWVDDENGDMICVGSVAELEQLTGRDLAKLDLHRPYVDEITFPNPRGTGGTMRRVPELIDVWFDSGSMPVAQWGYPHQNQEMFKAQFPADFISEAVDQTRGWFYTLHAISTMLFNEPCFKNVICLGHIQDEAGKKMSKSRAAANPWLVLDTSGADAFRWYLYTSGPPGESRQFAEELVEEVVKKFWSTLWNTYSFLVTYANLDGWTPGKSQPPVKERPLLDRWVLAELHQLVKTVTEAMETYDVPGGTRPVQAFVEVLSNWYVRLSRRRFWKSENDVDKLAAYATLYECVVTLAKLLAPTMPFLSEAMYRNLVVGVDQNAPDSVHLAQWPEFNAEIIDDLLIREMRTTQRLVSLGLAARNKAKMGVRQPLAAAVFGVGDQSEAATVERYTDLIMAELNVKRISLQEDYVLNPLPALLGKRFGKNFPRVQKMLREGESAALREWARMLLSGNNIRLDLDGEMVEITPEECEVKHKPPQGYAFAEEKGCMAALDITLTEDLILEGLAREVVRRIQNMRKDADFQIDDNIDVVYSAGEKLEQVIQQFGDYIKTETLALTLSAGEPDGDFYRMDFTPDEDAEKDSSIKGERLMVGIRRVKK